MAASRLREQEESVHQRLEALQHLIWKLEVTDRGQPPSKDPTTAILKQLFANRADVASDLYIKTSNLFLLDKAAIKEHVTERVDDDRIEELFPALQVKQDPNLFKQDEYAQMINSLIEFAMAQAEAGRSSGDYQAANTRQQQQQQQRDSLASSHHAVRDASGRRDQEEKGDIDCVPYENGQHMGAPTKRQRTTATAGARLTYQEVCAAGPPRDPLPEDFQPRIFRGESGKKALVVPPDDEDETEMDEMFLIRSENPSQGYKLFGKASVLLANKSRPNGWGEIFFAVVFPRIPPTAKDQSVLKFKAPDFDEVQYVAIKKLNKKVVNWYLKKGGHENPYKEISRMQQIGDGVHVLNCIEALEDDLFLYIVTPYSREGSLAEHMESRMGQGFPEPEAQKLFRNILQILLYLEKHGIFHHDFSPDNFLFFDGRLLLFDFAMSLRIPREPDGKRHLIKPQGVYGTPAFHSPEMYDKEESTPCDGVACDLWAAAVTLYMLLTGHLLYRVPDPTDILFRYYILAGGLKPGLNEYMVEILEETFLPQTEADRDRDNLMTHAMANLSISPDARELLINLLKMGAWERWTLIQAVESPWVQSNLG